MGKFSIFNTGCIRRALDSIRIYNYLIRNGWEFAEDLPDADLVIVATCGAVQEKEDGSLNTIKKVIRKKSEHARIIITGCLTTINPSKIHEIGHFEFVPTRHYNDFDRLLDSKIPLTSIPESNTITDNTDILNYVLAYRLFRNSGAWINIFNKYSLNRRFLKASILMSDIIGLSKSVLTFAKPQKIVPYYNISIAEGCMGSCAYCAIRFATGPLKSKPIENIIEEVEIGVAQGHQFIQLVSEDTGCYGVDMGTTMPALLKRVFEVPGDFKLILIDFNPRWIVAYWNELLPIIVKNQDRIREIFIPVQSGSDKILKSMQRYYTMTVVKPLLKKLREEIPKVRLRTTIIVGFPGETEADFTKSKQLVRDIGFYEVTLNKYEDRPNTASSLYPDKVPREVIAKRTEDLSKLL